MKDRDLYEALGGKMHESQPAKECPIKSLQDKSLVDENQECNNWDREVEFTTDKGTGKVNSFYSGEYDEHINSLVACAVLAVASTKKVNSKR